MGSFLVVLTCGAMAAAAASAGPDPAAAARFESKIRPLLVDKCVSCHGPSKSKGGLRLDSAEGLAKGGDAGPVVEPGVPDNSRLIEAVRYRGDLKMPPKGKLGLQEVAALADWVRDGAIWPESPKGCLDENCRKSNVGRLEARLVGVSASDRSRASGCPRWGLGAVGARSVHPVEAGRVRADARASGRSPRSDSSGDL